MRIESGTNSLDLTILGYQFPGITNEEYDSNWLLIAATAHTAVGQWSFEQPCLLTWEAGSIVTFLEQLAVGEASSKGVWFIEPNLSFEVTDTNTLKVFFTLESSPPWLDDTFVGKDDFYLEFTLTERQLQDAAASLRAQLAAFPGRAGYSAFRNAV